MILDENVVFKNFQIPNTATREKLPHLRDPNEKFPIWSFLKDMIGKDLSKFTMPGIDSFFGKLANLFCTL